MTMTMTMPSEEATACPADDDLMDKRELLLLVRRFGSRKTIERMISRGVFPAPLQWPGRRQIWRRSEVVAYLAAIGINVPSNLKG